MPIDPTPASTSTPTSAGASTSSTRTLTTTKIVLLVLAGVAPLTPIVSNIPVATSLGGPSMAGMYLLAGALFVCFSVGYAEMARSVDRIEGLWTFIRAGLGSSAAGGGALLALLGYFGILGGALSVGPYFFQSILSAKFGINLPWFAYTAALTCVVGVLASRQIDLSVRIVGVLVVGEIAVIVILAAAIVIERGTAAFPLNAFSWHNLISGNPGVVLMYATLSFLSFEAASLYASEARDPSRSVPRAIMITVSVIAAFFVLSTWVILGALGVEQSQAAAVEKSGDLLFFLSTTFGGSLLEDALSALMLTSLFATTLGLTNIAARNIRVLTTENLLPSWIGAIDARTGAPRRAALLTGALALVVVGTLGLVGANPYTEIGGAFFGIGSVAIVGAQLLTSVAVIVYLHRRGHRGTFRHRLLPVVGAAGLLAIMVVILSQFSLLTGKTEWYYTYLPVVALAVLVAGAIRGRQAGRESREEAVEAA